MDTENFQNELNEFIQALTVSDIWQDLKSSQRKIITYRAIADIASYLKISNTEINLEIPEIKQAVFEQTLHLTRQLRFQSDGRTILEENISGFGSRRYTEPDNSLLSERAKTYIDSHIEKNKFVRFAR